MTKVVSDYQQEVLVKKIETLIKALGTMIMVPTFLPSNDIGAVKQQGQPLQQGILQGEDRIIVETKLLELVSQL